jgi:hypothetical protein
MPREPWWQVATSKTLDFEQMDKVLSKRTQLGVEIQVI